MSRKTIFISWSGNTGKQIAEKLDKLISENIPNVSPWYSDRDIQAGNVWFNEVVEACNKADESIIIVTPSSIVKPWINFEAGILYRKFSTAESEDKDDAIKKMIPIIFTNNDFHLPEPLNHLQGFNWKEKNKFIDYLSRVSGEHKDKIHKWLEKDYKKWVIDIQKILTGKSEEENALISLKSTLETITSYDLNKNTIYAEIIDKFFQDTVKNLSDVGNKLELPAEYYPNIVINLQQNPRLHVVTKSIALYNRFETFWNTYAGSKIIETISAESARIFVYNSPEELLNDFNNLKLHAQRYTVYMLSHKMLTTMFPHHAKDFSIIKSGSDGVLAMYNEPVFDKVIQFYVDSSSINESEKKFEEIKSYSVEFTDYKKSVASDVFDAIKQLVFGHSDDIYVSVEQLFEEKGEMSKYEKRHIEMSKYININDYDAHEEKHAYYLEMLECMLSKIKTDNKIRVLEVGAGTGLLTKRICKLPNTEVVVIERDNVCFDKLQHKLKEFKNVDLLYDDSRVCDPPGKFDYIVSSFSDHHIRPVDKFHYLSNMKRNLKDNGLFIVGDEFLRDYDKDNEDDYVEALKKYHNHIIDIAKAAGENILASLETDALTSGINGDGDFKVSNKIYEEHLSKVDFKFEKELIGPKDIKGIGGIYVYTITK